MVNLLELRDRIDTVDAQLLDLLKERYGIVKEVAEYKAANGLPVYDAAREEAKIAKVRQQAEEEGLACYYEKIFRAVMEASRDSEELDIKKNKQKL